MFKNWIIKLYTTKIMCDNCLKSDFFYINSNVVLVFKLIDDKEELKKKKLFVNKQQKSI